MLRSVWPIEHVNPALVTLSHIYFKVWDSLTPVERTALIAALSGHPGHIGMSAVVKKYVCATATGRKAKTAKPTFTAADDFMAYLTDAVQISKTPDLLYAALNMMYTCGLSPTALATIRTQDLVVHGDGMLLLTRGYIYILTPTMRVVIEEWLRCASDKRKPFARAQRLLKQHAFLAESYDIAQSN